MHYLDAFFFVYAVKTVIEQDNDLHIYLLGGFRYLKIKKTNLTNLLFFFRFLSEYEFDEDIDLDDDERTWLEGDQLILRWKYCKTPILTGAAALI